MCVVVRSSQLRHVARVGGLDRRWILLTPCDSRSGTLLSVSLLLLGLPESRESAVLRGSALHHPSL